MTENVIDTTKQFTIERTFDAPIQTIWNAWTDPDIAARWWHPREVTVDRATVAIDLRVGGEYRYTMVGPDGTEYPTVGSYHEIDEPHRLVFTWGNPGDEAAPVITISLAEDGEGTAMTFHILGVDGQPGDDFIYDGWDQAIDILGETVS